MSPTDMAIMGALAASMISLFVWNFKRSVDIATRVAVLESKMEDLPDTLRSIKESIRDIYRVNTDTCTRITRIETLLGTKKSQNQA